MLAVKGTDCLGRCMVPCDKGLKGPLLSFDKIVIEGERGLKYKKPTKDDIQYKKLAQQIKPLISKKNKIPLIIS